LYDRKDSKAENAFTRIPLLRCYSVFNVEQCEGITAPLSAEAPEWPENRKIEKAEAIHLFMPRRPRVLYTDESRSYYYPPSDTVYMPKFSRFEKAAFFI
jgi:antirestriction protein ArdC